MLVGGERGPLPQITREPVDQRELDGLVECASAFLLSSPSVITQRGAEAEMDYLASLDEFVRELESAVEAVLGRSSSGVGDAPFEEAIVDLMTAVQSRLCVSVNS